MTVEIQDCFITHGRSALMTIDCLHRDPERYDSLWKWDVRFLEMAMLVASWSKDPSTKCGAVIVRPNRTIAAVGYNGFPRGVPDLSKWLNDREEKYQRVVHAEVNAVLSAKEALDDCTLYTWPPNVAPTCDRCATVVIQAGIKRVVFAQTDKGEFMERWRAACERSLDMYASAGVNLVAYSMEQ